MRIVEPSVEFITPLNKEEIYRVIETAGRVCYKSEDKIGPDSAEKFIRNAIKRGHESVIEHYNITVKFVTDRAIANELVRHRIAAYSQESTRYCNYSQDRFGNEIEVVKPRRIAEGTSAYVAWRYAVETAEEAYLEMVEEIGVKPEDARGVFPLNLKTELVATYNLREWRHILKLRGSKAAHIDVRFLMELVLQEFKKEIPVFFEDIELEV